MAKIVYIAHPIQRKVKENIQSVINICEKIHSKKIIPFAPYLLSLQYLDDAIPEERQKGIIAARHFFERKLMDEVWLCGPKISFGMKEEINLCLKNNIPIQCYNPELKSELEKILSVTK